MHIRVYMPLVFSEENGKKKWGRIVNLGWKKE